MFLSQLAGKRGLRNQEDEEDEDGERKALKKVSPPLYYMRQQQWD